MGCANCPSCRFVRCENVLTLKVTQIGGATRRSWLGRKQTVPATKREWVVVPDRFKWFCHWGDPTNWPQVSEHDFCRHYEPKGGE